MKRKTLFLEVTHLYGLCTDRSSQLLIRACLNNRQFHIKILFKFLNMLQSKTHPILFPNGWNQSRSLACIDVSKSGR